MFWLSSPLYRRTSRTTLMRAFPLALVYTSRPERAPPAELLQVAYLGPCIFPLSSVRSVFLWSLGCGFLELSVAGCPQPRPTVSKSGLPPVCFSSLLFRVSCGGSYKSLPDFDPLSFLPTWIQITEFLLLWLLRVYPDEDLLFSVFGFIFWISDLKLLELVFTHTEKANRYRRELSTASVKEEDSPVPSTSLALHVVVQAVVAALFQSSWKSGRRPLSSLPHKSEPFSWGVELICVNQSLVASSQIYNVMELRVNFPSLYTALCRICFVYEVVSCSYHFSCAASTPIVTRFDVNATFFFELIKSSKWKRMVMSSPWIYKTLIHTICVLFTSSLIGHCLSILMLYFGKYYWFSLVDALSIYCTCLISNVMAITLLSGSLFGIPNLPCIEVYTSIDLVLSNAKGLVPYVSFGFYFVVDAVWIATRTYELARMLLWSFESKHFPHRLTTIQFVRLVFVIEAMDMASCLLSVVNDICLDTSVFVYTIVSFSLYLGHHADKLRRVFQDVSFYLSFGSIFLAFVPASNVKLAEVLTMFRLLFVFLYSFNGV